MTTTGERSRAVTRTRERPLSDEAKARIIELAEQELPVRQIAAEVGCSTGSVSKVCKRAGIQLDRSRTQAAADAHRVSAAARRAELADELLAIARDELRRLRRTHTETGASEAGADHPVRQDAGTAALSAPRPDQCDGLIDRHASLLALKDRKSVV